MMSVLCGVWRVACIGIHTCVSRTHIHVPPSNHSWRADAGRHGHADDGGGGGRSRGGSGGRSGGGQRWVRVDGSVRMVCLDVRLVWLG